MRNDKARSSKAQIKMFESIIVLVVFFFLLVFGLVIYVKIDTYNSEKDAARNKALKAMEISQRIAFLSELQHTKEGVIVYDSVDMLKLEAFKRLSDNDKKIFAKIFPDTDIEINIIYPPDKVGVHEVYRGYDGPTDEGSAKPSFAPISIYDPVEEQYYFGYMKVMIYERE